jgi:hypothetical protein
MERILPMDEAQQCRPESLVLVGNVACHVIVLNPKVAMDKQAIGHAPVRPLSDQRDPNHSDFDGVVLQFLNSSHMGAHMPDAFADSTARLERLVEQIMKEKDPEKCDELGAEIWRVLDERGCLRSALAIQKRLDPK